jgi:hypothetical protein
MAKRGTTKRYSTDQEKFVAQKYDGTVSPSSGAASNDSGDVRAYNDLIECKMTGTPGKVCTKHETGDCPICTRTPLIRTFEKIAEEAYLESKSPVIALRFWCPDSPLSRNGWLDLSVRLLEEDAEMREVFLNEKILAENEYDFR